MKELKEVSKEEFDLFLNNYPNKLERDWFMDWFSWNDFTIAEMAKINSCNAINTYL